MKSSFQDAYCKVCKSFLRAHKSDLIRHASTTAHKKNISTVSIPKGQSKLTDNTNGIVIISNKQKENELLLAVHVGIHSSVKTIDHLSNIVTKISDEKVNLQLHRTKCSLLLRKVVAPCIRDDVIKDLENQPYSLIVDESTDVSTIKYLCVCIRYYSRKVSDIVVMFLGLVEIERATADALYNALKMFLTHLNINIKNMIGLGTDGANNLCGVNNSLFTKLKEDNSNIQLVKCICHSIDNAASHASEVLPSNLDFLCKEVYSFFSHSSLRQIEYKRLFSILNGNGKPFHKFVQMCPTRWLARYNAVNTILEHYEELKTHFKYVVQKEKCYTSRLINEMLEDKSNHLYFLIIRPVLYEVNSLNLNFQANNVDIGTAFDEIRQVIMFLAKKIFKPQFLKDFNELQHHIENELAFLELKDMDFGVHYHREIGRSELTVSQKNVVENRSYLYIKSLLKELLKRLPTSINHFKGLTLLKPDISLSQTHRPKFKELPFLDIFVEEKDIYKLDVQYSKLMEVDWRSLMTSDELGNSYKFWAVVLNYKNLADIPVFYELASFVLKILSLPMSNASAERIFSLMNITKSKIRNRMSLKMLNSLLMIKSYCIMNKVCCNSFQITKQMLEKFNNTIYYPDPSSTDSRDFSDGTELVEILSVLEDEADEDTPCISITEF